MANERWIRKATALAAAWERRYGRVPPKHTVVLALCPPSAETRCGDSWPGPDGELGTQDDENNWGATTLRSLSAEEQAAVNAAGIMPTVGTGHQDRARQAQAAIIAAGLPVASGTKRGVYVPRSTIHCDSRTEKRQDGRTVQVPYFVWFAAFDSETAGAEYYLTFVAEPGNPARAVLDNPKGTVDHLAAAMYARGYFWGFKPHGIYTHPGADKVLGTADDEQRDGNAENVSAYAAWLRPHFATISAALAGWAPGVDGGASPTEPVPEEPVDLRRADGVQRALNKLGCGRPLLKVDGDFATKSIAALGFYEGASGGWAPGPDMALIPVTGKFPLTAETLAAMRLDLVSIGVEVLP